MRIACTMDNYHIFGTQEVTLDNDALWANSSVAFENGDGTRYLFHFMPARHGGIYIIANEKELYRYHGKQDIKFLCGNHNEYTQRAILQLISIRDYDQMWEGLL